MKKPHLRSSKKTQNLVLVNSLYLQVTCFSNNILLPCQHRRGRSFARNERYSIHEVIDGTAIRVSLRKVSIVGQSPPRRCTDIGADPLIGWQTGGKRIVKCDQCNSSISMLDNLPEPLGYFNISTIFQGDRNFVSINMR